MAASIGLLSGLVSVIDTSCIALITPSSSLFLVSVSDASLIFVSSSHLLDVSSLSCPSQPDVSSLSCPSQPVCFSSDSSDASTTCGCFGGGVSL